MSIRRIRRSEMLSRAASSAEISQTFAITAGVMKKSASCPSVMRLRFAEDALPSLGMQPREPIAKTDEKSQPSPTNESSSFLLKVPVEIALEIVRYLHHGELLTLRRTSKACKTIADYRLVHSTALRLAISREKLDAAMTALESIEEAAVPSMMFNHRYLGVISNWHIDELRWMRNPSEEVRVVCRCLVALQQGHFARNYLSEPSEGDAAMFESWASTRAAMGTPEFRRWIANLRSGTEMIPSGGAEDLDRAALASYTPLTEGELLSSGRVWATQIWRSTSTGFGRMRSVSAVGHRALQFVSAAVHYISLRTTLAQARRMKDSANADVNRFDRFLKAVKLAQSS